MWQNFDQHFFIKAAGRSFKSICRAPLPDSVPQIRYCLVDCLVAALRFLPERRSQYFPPVIYK